MKILFRTMRYNWRYIFSKSNKIAVALFSVWGFVTLVTPTDIMLNCIDNIVLRIIVAALILMVIYFAIVIGITIYTKQRKQVKIFDLHSNHSLFVEYGDLFNSGDPNEEKNIAFAGNRCFDTIVDDDLIGSKKFTVWHLNEYMSKAIGIQIQSRMRYKTICHCMDISIQISNKKKNEVETCVDMMSDRLLK